MGSRGFPVDSFSIIKLSPVLVTSSFPLLVFTPSWVGFRLLTRLCVSAAAIMTGGGSLPLLLLFKDRITLKVMGQPASRVWKEMNYKGMSKIVCQPYLS